VDDLLILGSDRERGPWLRRLTVVAVLIALVVVVITHLPHKRETPAHHHAATSSAGPVQLAGLGSGAAGLLNQADGITRKAPSATPPSMPGGRLGHSHLSAGRHDAHHRPQHALAGASSGATLNYCAAALCCSLPAT
jgi:hypothetical protein